MIEMPRVSAVLMRGAAGDGWWLCRPLAEEVRKGRRRRRRRRMLGKGGRGMEVA